MTEVVLVTAWRRPAFLQACLDRLTVALADGYDYRVRVCLDRGASAEVAIVAHDWCKQDQRAKLVRRADHRYSGNSCNVLYAYRDALGETPALVHLVEEDVLVGHDYFAYHRQAHALVPDAFSVNACRNQNLHVDTNPEPDPAAVYLHGMYQSIGVSFKPRRLKPAMTHVNSAYLGNPVRYCKLKFPNSRIAPAHAEQDGLLHRLQERDGLSTVYPAVPRAYHIGFIGYHRNGQPLDGTIREQADQLLAMDADEMNRRAHSYPDHATVPLDGHRDPVSRLIQWP